MNSETQQELERILKIDPGLLNPTEIGFLNARISYFTPEKNICQGIRAVKLPFLVPPGSGQNHVSLAIS